MAQQYFLSHANVDPKLIQASREKLDVGYRKLLGYRTTDMGYECFGKDPGHGGFDSLWSAPFYRHE